MDFDDLLHQAAPISIVYDALCKSYTWPSERAQNAVVQTFVGSANANSQPASFLPPQKYLKGFIKLLDRDLTSKVAESVSRDGEDDVYTDEFAELCVEWLTKPCSDSDADSGFVSYRPYRGTDRVPILIKRNSNQVGTKVWSAGLILAEYLPRLLIKPNKPRNQMLLVVELGAGVGITSILLHASASAAQRPMQITATDCFESVLEVLENNISSVNTIFPSSSLFMHSYNLDWLSISEEDWDMLCDANLLFAADCTYSPDLNIALVELFTEYFRRYFLKHGQDKPTAVIEDKALLLAQVSDGDLPAIIISCTVRNEGTFQHFIELLLSATGSLHHIDITEHARQAAALYYVPDRNAIKTFLVIPSQCCLRL